jgi:DNA-binding XRE family transcriptional regulator
MTGQWMRPLDKTEIAGRFTTLRRHTSLTQRELAELIGIGRQAVSEIENKRTLPHCGTWRRFAALEAKHMQPQPTLPVHWN